MVGKTSFNTHSIVSTIFCRFAGRNIEIISSPHTPCPNNRCSVLTLSTFSLQAINGQAIDRHLLGLKLICIEAGMKLPEIFRDRGYNYSLHFKLSTSQVSS